MFRIYNRAIQGQLLTLLQLPPPPRQAQAVVRVKVQIANGTLQGTLEQAFTTSNPRWNPSDGRDYALLVGY